MRRLGELAASVGRAPAKGFLRPQTTGAIGFVRLRGCVGLHVDGLRRRRRKVAGTGPSGFDRSLGDGYTLF